MLIEKIGDNMCVIVISIVFAPQLSQVGKFVDDTAHVNMNTASRDLQDHLNKIQE